MMAGPAAHLGAISKTINMPNDAAAEIADAYTLPWKLALKANALTATAPS